MLFIISVFVRRISAWVEEVGMIRRLRIEAVNLSINSESSFVIYWLGKWIYQSDSSSVLNRALFSKQNFVFILFGSYLLSATSSPSNSQKIIPGSKKYVDEYFRTILKIERMLCGSTQRTSRDCVSPRTE